MKTKTISVFVAGAKNLQPLRLQLKAMANDLNNEYKQNGWDIAVNMVSYENFGDEQSEYNKFITEEADMILFLLDDRIGEKTEDEYRLTVERQKKAGRPEHCVFLKEFKVKTDEIAHIEELMSSTSNKYYVNYKNPEDLIAKAKTRITELAMKKSKGFELKSSHKRSPIKRIMVFLFFLLALAAAFRFALGSPETNYVYFEMPGIPKSLEQYGINEKYLEQQLLHTLQNEAVNAQDKINQMLDDTVTQPDWTISFPSKVKTVKSNRLRKSLRNILGCHDLIASLHLIESDNSVTSNLFITDWNGKEYNTTTLNRIEDLKDAHITSSLLIRKNAANLSFPFNPIVSALYDYHIVNELLEYQMVSPWKDEIYSSLEKEAFLRGYAQSGLLNSIMANLILGNYYEYQGIENGYDKTNLTKAIDYYAPLQNDISIGDFITNRIETLNVYMASDISTDKSIVDMLESKGAFQTKDCEQLIIVANEESLIVKSKRYFKATLYTFERNEDNGWEEVFPAFKVNLASKGLVEAKDKVEGDLKTPTGYYSLPFAFGKNNDLQTHMDFMKIGTKHIWVCDTTSSDYNKIVVDKERKYMSNKVNEKLFRNDELYDYCIAIGYNFDPIVIGKGSAITMHIQRSENHRTAGCISMPRENIIKLIEWLDSAKQPHIYICKQLESE